MLQLRKWLSRNPLLAVGVAAVFCWLIFAISRPANLDAQVQSEPLVSVSKTNDPGQGKYVYQTGSESVVITARSEITVQQVVLNRGSCTGDDTRVIPGAFIKGPETLQFGEIHRVSANCVVIEAKVQTDKGTWTFTW
jgi:hypothetical protein